jgi:DNA-binding NarL/FixJ family response regulator
MEMLPLIFEMLSMTLLFTFADGLISTPVIRKRTIARYVYSSNGDEDLKFKQRSRCWIILVDDEETIRKAVGQYLFDQGYQVTACADAKTALQLSRNRKVLDERVGMETSRIPDLIISDVRMPEMDGLEFLKELRRDTRLMGVPVILLTAKGMVEDRVKGFQAGADAYVPKPFEPEELLSIIDNAILRYRTLSKEEVLVEDLQRDLENIKKLLIDSGGGTVGHGRVENTKVFLTPDERQVLEYLCQGMYNQEIAQNINLSRSRVDSIISSMLRKTKLDNRTQLVRWAISTGNVQI